MIDTIYYDGDSFSFLGVDKNTGDCLAEHYGTSLIKKCQAGKSPAKIINDFLTTDHNAHTLYVIGIGVSSRGLQVKNGALRSVCQRTFAQNGNDTVDDFLTTIETNEYLTMQQVLLLSGYCKSLNLKYVIHDLDFGIFKKFDNQTAIVDQYKQDKHLLGFFDGCSLHELMKAHELPGYDSDLYGDMAHPTTAGHRMYADFLIEKLSGLYKL